MKKAIALFTLIFLSVSISYSQELSKLCLIDNIAGLESNKDPKCYATANRLEDFMYGTPLANETREHKVVLQKKLILYIWDKASKNCKSIGKDTIESVDLKDIVNELSRFGKLKSGDYYFTLGQNILTIKPNDLRQYSSVAYSLRAMLSVEQDFLFNPNWQLNPITYKAINDIKFFIDLATLATLKLADEKARSENRRTITSEHFDQSWNQLFEGSPQRLFLDNDYPKLNSKTPPEYNYSTLKEIISQKVRSYENYNQISLPILLRNIQVYFARHKWPTEINESDLLKNYLIESLVYLSSDIIKVADQLADQDNEIFIRNNHIDKAVNAYLTISINEFEDVTYFPNIEEAITIESYDLDAFRDSGLHWKILEYCLSNLDPKEVSELDPFAAEIMVEAIAQWALLILRITGDISRQNEHEKITQKDMEDAFIQTQNLIFKSEKAKTDDSENKASQIKSSSDNTSIDDQVFFDATSETGINFYHKSSDWLSRKIRSYVLKKDENLIRMAIPPAFGGSGLASEDINNDGYQDLFLAGGMGNKLYINNQDGTFKDITESSGIDTWNAELQSYAEVRQVIINDFDNDGLQDIFLSLVNENHKLYKNINGTQFEYVSSSHQFEGQGKVGGPATAFDYNNDGLLDIYIGYFGNYLDGDLPSLDRNNQNGSPNALFKNTGNLKFEKVDHIADEKEDLGWTQALVHMDINQDGYQDIIVGNDFGINAYYMNDGEGQFSNKNKELATSKPSYTMSIGSADLNKDLYPDLYISNIVVMEKDEKYVNPSGKTTMNFDPEKMKNIRTVEANDLFISKSDDKLQRYDLSDNIGRGYSSTGWSWDADFFDFDNDGDEDLYCLNGMNDFMVYGTENPVYKFHGDAKDVLFAQSHREKNVFFTNENGFLKEQSSLIGGDLESNSRSAVYLDIENDGDLDIVVNNYHDKAIVLKNNLSTNKNWIKIKLEGDVSKNVNRDAIGSVIIVRNSANGLQIWREVHSTTGYLSVHPKQQHFGVADSKLVDIEIKWSNGTKQEFKNVKSNNAYTIMIDKEIRIIK